MKKVKSKKIYAEKRKMSKSEKSDANWLAEARAKISGIKTVEQFVQKLILKDIK